MSNTNASNLSGGYKHADLTESIIQIFYEV